MYRHTLCQTHHTQPRSRKLNSSILEEHTIQKKKFKKKKKLFGGVKTYSNYFKSKWDFFVDGYRIEYNTQAFNMH